MCCWNKVCGAEKMTDNSQEKRPDMNPIPQRQVLAALGWEGRAVFSNTTLLPGRSNLLLHILPGSKYLLPLKNVNF